jgi:sensor c-di-GMP phosphodiesterase-like protein
MRLSKGPFLVICIGIAAAAAPIVVSVSLVRKLALTDQSALAATYSSDTIHRFDETGAQMAYPVRDLEKAANPPCSPAEIDLMRRIEISSSYIQGLGRVSNSQIVCSSFGSRPIPLGPPTLVNSAGTLERLNVRLPIADDHPVDVFQIREFAFIITPELAIDIRTASNLRPPNAASFRRANPAPSSTASGPWA